MALGFDRRTYRNTKKISDKFQSNNIDEETIDNESEYCEEEETKN